MCKLSSMIIHNLNAEEIVPFNSEADAKLVIDPNAVLSFPITVDTEAPEVLDMTVREAEGRFYATITVRDNEYVSAVVFNRRKNS